MKLKEPKPDLRSEVGLGFLLPKIIIGVDEVGRGCLAGPVVAAAAVLPAAAIEELWFDTNGVRRKGRVSKKHPHSALQEVKDSKMIREPDREPLRDQVAAYVRGYSVAEASVEEIETLNILYASHLAMERAVGDLEASLGIRADAVLVDGHIVPQCFLGRGYPLIKGDQKSLTIACASIIAKVYRDQMMARFEVEYPGYGMKVHKGYGTAFHRAQIQALGITPIHRKSFRGVVL
jgi:ribonuclease HII